MEAERAANAPGPRRPDLGGVPRPSLFALGMLAALRALGLVLIAEAVAHGIAALAADGIDAAATRHILIAGCTGTLLRAGTEWATAVLARHIASGVKRELRARLWRRIVAGDTESGSTAVLASDGLDALDDYYIQSLPALISAAVVPLLIGVRILGADWVSAVVIVLTVPLVPLFMTLIGKHTQQRTDRALATLARLADHLTDLARGLPVLVGLGRVEEQTLALDTIQRTYRARTLQTLRWAFLSALALELVATISVAIVAVFLGLRLLNGTMGLEPALLALILAPECFTALREVGTAFHASQDGLAALDRTKAMLGRDSGRDVRTAGAGQVRNSRTHSDADVAVPASAVVIERLSVRYAGRDSPALEEVSAVLTGVVSVAGPSGAGKSTLLAALAGTLPADADVTGTVTGVDADEVGWAPQRPRAFAPTPRLELMMYGSADPLAALGELDLLHVADANVAELSPGEQRRLAVARALARVDDGARLLVLDEPTAHLDRAAADRVRTAIRRRMAGTTVVLASHERETQALATSTLTVGPAFSSATPTPADPLADTGAPAEPPAETAAAHPAHSAGRDALAQKPNRGLTLGSLLRPHARAWAGAVALGTIGTGMGLALTAVSGWLIVRASIEDYIMYLLVAIVGVRAFGIGRSVGRYAERLATHRAAFGLIDELRLRLWRAIAARGTGSRRLLEGGAPLDYLVTLADELRDLLPRVLPPLAVGTAVLLGTGVATTFVAPQLAVLIVVALATSVVVASGATIAAERGAGRARITTRSEIVRGTEALATAAGDLRGNGVVHQVLSHLDAAAGRLAAVEGRAAWSAGLGTAVVTATSAALAFTVPLLSSGLSAERASVIALLALAVLEPLTTMVTAAHRIPALREVLLRLSPVLQPVPAADWGEAAPARPVTELTFDRVSVQYPGADRPAVTAASGVAAPGRWLVLEGPSGSGKSTLLSAAMGTLRVSSGSVRAGRAPLTALAAPSWRSCVAWCPQDAYVFNSTLRGNLLLARPRNDPPSDSQLRTALARAGLGTLLTTLPNGLATRVGPGGMALSGGERQRLAVARALLTRADIILLDEPTAHLDAATAAAMMVDVRAATAGRTVVLVSHRADDRRPQDSVLTLDGATSAVDAPLVWAEGAGSARW